MRVVAVLLLVASVGCGSSPPSTAAPSAVPSSVPSPVTSSAPSSVPSPSGTADPAFVRARITLGDASVKPCGVVGDGAAVWVSGFGSNTLYRIDPATRKVTDTVPVGTAPCGLAFGAGSIWTSDYAGNTVTRVSVSTRRIVATVKVGKSPFDAAFGAGSAWVTNGTDGTVSRISPATNAVVATIRVGPNPAGVAVVGDSAWVPVGSGEVVRISTASNKVTQRVRVGSAMATWLSHGAGALWVSSPNDSTVTQVDTRAGRVVGRANGLPRAADGDVLGGDVWVPLRGTTGVARIDRASRRAVTVPVPLLDGFVLAGAFGAVWVPDFGGTDVLVVDPAATPKP